MLMSADSFRVNLFTFFLNIATKRFVPLEASSRGYFFTCCGWPLSCCWRVYWLTLEWKRAWPRRGGEEHVSSLLPGSVFLS